MEASWPFFSAKGLSYTGYGKTKETAIHFIKVRSQLEAIEMIKRYIQEKNMNLTGLQQVAGIDEGCSYGTYPTEEGNVWFKTKMMW